MKTCINPDCGKEFDPGHYGDRQVVCSQDECRLWYKANWELFGGIRRGVPAAALEKVVGKMRRLDQKTLILLARFSGLRKGELLGLCWVDVLTTQCEVREHTVIRRQWNDKMKGFTALKTRRPRHVYFLERARHALEIYKKSIRWEAEDRVFPITGATAYRWWIAGQRSAKVYNPETGQPYRFHDLRHSLGLELVSAGKLHLAQKVLGHSNVNTTMKYAEQSPDDVLRELEG